jgi:hypothetical protein
MIDAHGELAIRCIRQLIRLWAGARQGLPEIPEQLPYAVSHWSSHLTRVVGVKMEEAEGDNESISTPDTVDIVSDPETTSGAQVGVEATEKRTHTSDVLCVIFSPDGRRMAVAQAEFIRLRDTQTGHFRIPPGPYS